MNNATQKTDNSKTLIVYHYFENDRTYAENFLNFLVFGYSEENDHIVVVAGESSIDFPTLDNIEYVHTENHNNDYGGYCEVVSNIPRIFDYDHVIFVNSSVRGPYTQPGCNKLWTAFFTDRLVNGVGIVGSTVNVLPVNSIHSVRYKEKFGGQEPFTHVQTMVYAVPREVLLYLKDKGFYQQRTRLEKFDVVEDYEIHLSRLILAGGWTLSCLLPEYGLLDYRTAHQNPNPTASEGDPSYQSGYFGRSAHPFEVIFAKTNRGIFKMEYFERLSYSALFQRQLPRTLLASKSVTNYLGRLMLVSKDTAKYPFSDMQVSAEDIVSFVRQLVNMKPEFKATIQSILNKAP